VLSFVRGRLPEVKSQIAEVKPGSLMVFTSAI
jgi:hypothetical protein